MYREMGADEEYLVDGGRRGAHDSTEGAEKARTRESRNNRTLVKSTSTPCDPQSPDQTHCATDKCDVITGSETYCSQCEDTHVSIDGVCNTIDNANGKCTPKNDGSCSACLEPYYLYSGGCYAACPDGTYADSSAHKCTACGGTYKTCSGAGIDKCTSCSTAENYLKLTDSSAGTGECVAKGACGTAQFEVEADKKCYPCGDSAHGGVADCTTCTPKEGDPAKAKCTACGNSKVPNADGSACVDAPLPPPVRSRAARRAAMQIHALTMQMDMSRLAALRLAQRATRAASPAKPVPLNARRAPADTTRLPQEMVSARPVSLAAGVSRASAAVRAAQLHRPARASSSTTSWICLHCCS